jgi:ATP-dependent DNA helicase RecQ
VDNSPDSAIATKRILKEVFGFDNFRPGQARVVDTLLAGRNVLAVMPTGSGKSLCFQIPALIYGGLTIVVSPLVALMRDQVAALQLAGVRAETINSSCSRDENVAAWRRVASGETRILYLSPERLMTERMLAALGQQNVRLIAIDEAHCISQWGPSFRPEYQDLSGLSKVFPGIPVAALTATADEVTREDIVAQLFAGDAATVVLGFDRPNIKLAVEMKKNWKAQMLAFVRDHEGESGIIYCLSRKKTEEAALLLRDQGINALPYHAGMDSSEREKNQNTFMTEPATVITATIAFGMGIDKSDVRFVFHADLPGSIEAYYQEIGRAGRDGHAADAHMLYGLDDIRMRRVFIEQENAGEDRKRREYQRLDALLGYCEASTCRRQTLLTYFGEVPKPCGNCDLCLSPVELEDGTTAAQKILSAIHRTGQRYGALHIIDILLGTGTPKITAAGHDSLPMFGAGTDKGKDEWRSLIRQLVAADFLLLDVRNYGGLAITARGQTLLSGETSFSYRKDMMLKAAPRKAKGSGASAIDLSAIEGELFGRLKALRLALAREHQVPAFVIFSDKTLADMAQKNPRTRDEFAGVNGVGSTKLEKFADRFLEVTRSTPEES